MLARNTSGIVVEPHKETELCRWTADGDRQLVGFIGTGSYSAEFRLYVDESGESGGDPWYTARISYAERTAYVADRGTRLNSGDVVRLCVYHEADDPQEFKATILGG